MSQGVPCSEGQGRQKYSSGNNQVSPKGSGVSVVTEPHGELSTVSAEGGDRPEHLDQGRRRPSSGWQAEVATGHQQPLAVTGETGGLQSQGVFYWPEPVCETVRGGNGRKGRKVPCKVKKVSEQAVGVDATPRGSCPGLSLPVGPYPVHPYHTHCPPACVLMRPWLSTSCVPGSAPGNALRGGGISGVKSRGSDSAPGSVSQGYPDRDLEGGVSACAAERSQEAGNTAVQSHARILVALGEEGPVGACPCPLHLFPS